MMQAKQKKFLKNAKTPTGLKLIQIHSTDKKHRFESQHRVDVPKKRRDSKEAIENS